MSGGGRRGNPRVAIVTWGRYAEVFAYDEQAQAFSLENRSSSGRNRPVVRRRFQTLTLSSRRARMLEVSGSPEGLRREDMCSSPGNVPNMKKIVWLGGVAAACLPRLAGAVGRCARAKAWPARTTGPWGFDPAAIDKAVKPGDDFYSYANGNALKTMEIPSDRTRYGNFDVLSVVSENRVHAILESAAAHPKNAREAKIGAYYKAFMDEARVEKLGDAPLQKDLAQGPRRQNA